MSEPNGAYKFNERFDKVDRQLIELKDDLAGAIRELSNSIAKQSVATESLGKTVSTLTTQFTTFLNIAMNAIPLKAVFWMFGILVLTIGGIEAVKVASKMFGVLP